VKVIKNEVINPKVIIHPKSIIGLISLNIKDKKDPIENFQKHLLNEGLDEDEFKKIDKEIKEIVSEAADFALESSEPDLTDLYKDIYLDN